MGASTFFLCLIMVTNYCLPDVYFGLLQRRVNGPQKTSEARVFALMRGSERCPKRNDPERKGTQKLKENIKQSQECDN